MAKRGKNQARDERTAAKRRAESRKIMRLHLLGYSIVSIAKKVGRCYNTIKKRIDEYTEKLGELFSQREIRMLFQQHAKRMVEELKKHATSISFFDEPIYYADRDKSNLSQLLVEGLAHQSGCKRESQRKRGGGSACMHLAAKGWYAK